MRVARRAAATVAAPAPTAVLTFTVFLLTACASGAPGSPDSNPRRDEVRVETPTQTHAVQLVREDLVTTGWVPADMDRTWKALQAVYLDLGVNPATIGMDAVHHRIGFTDQRLRRLAGERLSRYLNCGQTMGIQQADQGHTSVTLISWLEPDEARTTVHTRLQAMASSNSSTAASPCGTTGRLEQLVMNKLLLDVTTEGS